MQDKSTSFDSQRTTIRDCLCKSNSASTSPSTAGASLGPKVKPRLLYMNSTDKRLRYRLSCNLLGTPWLSSNWGLQDIYLLNSGPQNLSLIHAQPYVRRSFVGTKALTNTAKATARPLVANGTVFALGAILLELSFGQPLSSFKTATDIDARKRRTIYRTHDASCKVPPLPRPLARKKTERISASC
jgi:hypothetical protein